MKRVGWLLLAVLVPCACSDIEVAEPMGELAVEVPQHVGTEVPVPVSCTGGAPWGDSATYTWTASDGEVTPDGPSATWIPALREANVEIGCAVVVDGREVASASATTRVVVRVQDLVAWYPFDGTAEDATGNGHHGEAIRGTWWTDRNGEADRALRFEGMSAVEVPDADELDLTEFTLMAFATPDFIGRDGTILWKPISAESLDTTGNFRLWALERADMPDIWYLGYNHRLDPPTDGVAGLGAPLVRTLGWSHVAVTVGATSDSEVLITAYVDGVWSGEVPVAPPLTSDAPLFIGWAPPARPERPVTFVGALDDVRIYRAALTEEEVGAVAASPL